jgi:hypothetical protein
MDLSSTQTETTDASTPTHVIASSLGLTAFAVAVTAGLAVGTEPVGLLFRAMAAMFACYGVGLGLGTMGVASIREHLEDYKEENPVPEIPAIPNEEGKEDPPARRAA